MANSESKYDRLGVSASKSEVHAAIRNLDKGLYPEAFCKILPDVVASDPAYCNLLHADTAGTKTSLAYIYWRETGDTSVWAGIAQDAIVMNLDDMACVGCVSEILLSNTIGRNKKHIPGEVIEALIEGGRQFLHTMQELGVSIHLAGGETADVGDIVRTVDVGYTAFARMPREQVVVNNIQAGDVIVGLSSSGQASYETEYNGGMGSNGLTAARHQVFSKQYAAKYPESFEPGLDPEIVYSGPYNLTDSIEVNGRSLSVGKLVLSPTRTYLPIISRALSLFRSEIHGLIHCTGGGQTKVGKFMGPVHVIKDNLFDLPPLFSLIQQSSGMEWREMYQVFNMGHRMECYVPESVAPDLMAISESFGIHARIVGKVEASDRPLVTVSSPFGTFHYEP